jgi:hypothetical protein
MKLWVVRGLIPFDGSHQMRWKRFYDYHGPFLCVRSSRSGGRYRSCRFVILK